MSAIFESETLGPTERLILLALADHADDSGRCYPSMGRLSRRTGLSERAIQTNVKKLTATGYLTVVTGGGKGHANLYFVSANPSVAEDKPRSICTPQEMHPAAGAPQTPQQVPVNPAAGAPEPSRTIKEPSEEEREALAVLFSVMSQQSAFAFVAHRKAKRAKLTVHAAELIAAKLRGHHDPDAVVNETIMNGWTGIFPEKRTKSNGAPNGQPTSKSEQRMAAFLSGARVS